MKKFATVLILFILIISFMHFPVFAQTASNEVAITFDDLPAINSVDGSLKIKKLIISTLVPKLKKLKIPAIGFVNEIQLYDNNELNNAYVKLLRQWINAGLELGNHTYSHPDINNSTLENYEKDFLRGEVVTRNLLKEKGKTPRFFRHPYLHTGTDLETKMNFELFLAQKGYAVAPVTVDNSDWIFAAAYDKALQKKDTVLANQVAAEYIPYMGRKFAYYEKFSNLLFGRNIKQILLIHANRLNADTIDKLAEMLVGMGYTFVSVKEALTDPAYNSEDKFVGKGGISWIQRWALTKGINTDLYKGEPHTPDFVLKAAGVNAE
jgi:peptidoglycan/xylan/chitin deacetylase (PgdA/CDA1 family)